MRIRMPEYKWRTFIVTGLANITMTLSTTSLNLALPIMANEFGVSMTVISRLALLYTLVYCCTLLVFGKMADLHGYKRQFVAGFIIFGLASLLLPILSRGLASLIFFRCMQGVGGSMLIAITQAMCNRAFPAEERGRALGINAVFVSAGLAVGPSVGGLLLARFSWHAIFYFNIPFAIIGAVMAALVLRKDKPYKTADRRMDIPGTLFFGVFIVLLSLAINYSEDWGLISVKFFVCLLISALMFFIFMYRESHTDMPLMNLELYKNPVFALANGASVSSYTLQSMTTFLVPFFLIDILRLSESMSGFIILASPVSMMIFSPLGGKMTDRYGSRPPALIGLLSIAAGCIIMSLMTAKTSGLAVAAVLVLYGMGNGFSVCAINAAIFSAVPREHSGMASGTVATVRNMGNSLGVAFGGAIMALRESHYLAQGERVEATFLLAQRDAYYFGLLVVAIAIFCMIKIPNKRQIKGGDQSI